MPKKGLVEKLYVTAAPMSNSFNPAEAEEGFSRIAVEPSRGGLGVSIQPKPKKGLVVSSCYPIRDSMNVSIQPKPKKGLVAEDTVNEFGLGYSFNPAEAEEGFSRST